MFSTDSQEIADVAISYGAKIPFLRPDELSKDDSMDVDFIQHYLEIVSARGEADPDLIVLLRPTTPLRDICVIDKAIEYMKNDSYATSLRSMHKSSFVPYKMFKKEGVYAKPVVAYDSDEEFYNWPRQRFDGTYDPNGYVDILRPNIIRNGKFTGERLKIWETQRVPDIDTLDDFNYAMGQLTNLCYERIRNHLEKTYGQLS